jgi:hypothetical protein
MVFFNFILCTNGTMFEIGKIMKKLIVLQIFVFACSFFVKAQHLTFVMINACGEEGANEYVIMKNGDSSLTVSSAHIDFRYGTNSPAATTYTDSFLIGGNPDYVDSLNKLLPSACDFQFINAAAGDTIPSNANFFVMHKAPTDTPDFTNWCGLGLDDVYITFSDDNSWNTTGNFANSSAGCPGNARYFRTIINGYTLDYEYWNTTNANCRNWSSNEDGNFVTFGSTGGQPTSYGNFSGCTPTNLSPLPVSWLYFNGYESNYQIKLEWSTASEINNSHFEIQRSIDGITFEKIGEVNGHGTINEISTYHFNYHYDRNFAFYRLKQIDFDGQFDYSEIIKIHPDMSAVNVQIFPNPAKDAITINLNDIDITGQTQVVIQDYLGRIVYAETIQTMNQNISVSSISAGTYLVVVEINGNSTKQKLIISK